MNPNALQQPPVEQQPNPNVLGDPNVALAVPEVNQAWETEDNDRYALQEILDKARRIAESESTASGWDEELKEAQAAYNAAKEGQNADLMARLNKEIETKQSWAAQAQRDRQAQRKKNRQTLTELIKDGNPSTLFAILNRERQKATEQVEQAAKNAIGARQSAEEIKTVSKRHTVGYRSASRNDIEPPTTARERAVTRIKAGEAGREARFAERHHSYNAGYPDEIAYLMEAVGDAYGQTWQENGRLNQEISKDLRKWDIAGGPATEDLPQAIEQKLTDFRASIDSLPRSDAARAEALADYNRLFYRFMSRDIQFKAAKGQEPVAEFTPNGGIYLKGESVVIHADSSIERPDPTTGEWMRKTPSGEDWRPPTASELQVDDEMPPHSWKETFTTWEESRSNQDAQRTYSALSEHIGRQERVEAQNIESLGLIQDQLRRNRQEESMMSSQVRSNEMAITDLSQALENLRQNAAALEATSEKAEILDLIHDRENHLNQLRRHNEGLNNQILKLGDQNNQLKHRGNGLLVDLKNLRAELNPARYWQGFLQINTYRKAPEAKQARRGRWTIRREVVTEEDVPLAPDINLDGSLRFEQLNMNGRNTEWIVRPNGFAARYDPDQRRYILYNQYGEIIS